MAHLGKKSPTKFRNLIFEIQFYKMTLSKIREDCQKRDQTWQKSKSFKSNICEFCCSINNNPKKFIFFMKQDYHYCISSWGKYKHLITLRLLF